jgi:hypothetical protein
MFALSQNVVVLRHVAVTVTAAWLLELSAVPDWEAARGAASPPVVKFQLENVESISDETSLEPTVIARDWVAIPRRELSAIDIFDKRGRWIARLPSRYDNVFAVGRTALVELPSNRLALLDSRHNQIITCHISKKHQPHLLANRIQLARRYVDMQYCRNKLLLFGSADGGSIDAVDRLGNVYPIVKAAGKEISPEESLSDSRLACDDARGEIVVVNETTARISVFSKKGEPLWNVQPEGVSPQRITVRPNGVTYDMPPAGYDRVVRAAFIGRDSLLLQLRRVGNALSAWGSLGTVTTIVFDTRTRKQIKTTSAYPFLIANKGDLRVTLDPKTHAITLTRYSGI